jgi:hypothetical protein
MICEHLQVGALYVYKPVLAQFRYAVHGTAQSGIRLGVSSPLVKRPDALKVVQAEELPIKP